MYNEQRYIYPLAGMAEENTHRSPAEDERDCFCTMSLNRLSIISFDGYFKRVPPAGTQIIGCERNFLRAPSSNFSIRKPRPHR
ncbi:MAG: hypothetical protein KME26_33500 [Oscillatoria princeps RMCB-10]|nr:hypothetical protein [Oscillatoria princeps RMCB-10]